MLPIIKTELLPTTDFEWLKEKEPLFRNRFRTRPIFRSRYEIEQYVLSDQTHPTPDAKYWQVIGEQSTHVQEMINLQFDFKKSEVELKKLYRRLDNEEDDLERELLQIDIERMKFAQANMAKTLQERFREVKNCEDLIDEIEPHLKFGNEDYEKHIPEREKLRELLKSTNQIDLKSLEMTDDPIFLDFFKKDVSRILVATPHRTDKDGNVTNFDILQPPAAFTLNLVRPHGMSVPDARNWVFRKALTEGFEWVFFVDDDVIIPRMALVELMATGEKLIGGVYYRKYEPLESVCMIDVDNRPSILRDEHHKPGEVIDALVLPSGCTLIHRSLIESIEPPWYKSFTVQGKPAMTEDTYFTGKAVKAGFTPKIHTGVQCLHVDIQRNIAYGHKDIINENKLNPKYAEYFCTY